ncbi:helix-turn-helix domain-containing protein [Paenibacillus filicis]|uniref:Helix-turn-helix domain-containing protein n=1 Tax=Paenibacillus gyeongsangnamensis TaxID=3388067 RepID=A0ABT4QAJ6_9BACL|nr:helix-turn-helix domain-containing protein [Paenibacillus filicis]MCZ8513902.1 helix-turn-helix domain-containing protein [Paenibacillus filicis]
MRESHECSMSQAVQLLSKRWTIFLLDKLLEGPQRFSGMEGCLAISGRLLSERLKELEAEGLVQRNIYPETPVRVEYVLTEKGRAFKPVLDEIRNWSLNWGEPRDMGCGGAEGKNLPGCGESGPACEP